MSKTGMKINVKTAAKKAMFNVKKHSPEILIVAGIAGVVTSAVMACKATMKVNEVLAETKENINKVHDVITRSRSNTPGSKVSYRSYYDRRDEPARVRRDSRYGSAYDYDELVFETRGDAERVLVTLDEIMDTYKMVKVADLYDAAGRTPSYVMFNYGWTDINSAAIVRTSDGYMIRLPRTLPLD